MTPYNLLGHVLHLDEIGIGATDVFDPTSPKATDTGPVGMVAEMQAFVRLTADRWRLLDIGALFGIFSLMFTNRIGKAAVALEPSPYAWEYLNIFVSANEGDVLPLQVFAGDTRRTVRCGRDWKHVVANLQSCEMIDLLEVPIDELGLGDFDTVKIDVEGYEVQVLRGARKMLERCRPLIFLEVHTLSLSAMGESVASLRAVLDELGYRMTDYSGADASIEGTSITRVLCVP